MWQTVTGGVAWSDCRPVCLSWSSALLKRLNWSKCHFGCEFGWVQQPWLGADPLHEGAFWEGKGWPIVKYRSLLWAVQKWLNWLRCCLGYGLGSMCYIGVHNGATWRIRLNPPCVVGFLSNHFDHLLLLIHNGPVAYTVKPAKVDSNGAWQ